MLMRYYMNKINTIIKKNLTFLIFIFIKFIFIKLNYEN